MTEVKMAIFNTAKVYREFADKSSHKQVTLLSEHFINLALIINLHKHMKKKKKNCCHRVQIK